MWDMWWIEWQCERVSLSTSRTSPVESVPVGGTVPRYGLQFCRDSTVPSLEKEIRGTRATAETAWAYSELTPKTSALSERSALQRQYSVVMKTWLFYMHFVRSSCVQVLCGVFIAQLLCP